MNFLELSKGSNRNTQCYKMRIGSVRLFWSYETCIGIACSAGRVRRKNCWGPTTGRHMTDMGIQDYDEIEDVDTFNQFVKEQVVGSILEEVKHVLSGGAHVQA